MLPVIYLPAFESYIKKIKDKVLKEKIRNAVAEIRENPNLGEAKKGDLSGILCYDIYYQKTNYEIAYSISHQEDGSILVVIMAGTRENFYEVLKRYMKD
jgi:putative component of toxin-antitoxin plasmid stabilization module